MALPSASSFTVLDQSPAENFTEPASVPLSAAVTVAVSSRVSALYSALVAESTAGSVVGVEVFHLCMFSAMAADTFTNAPWRVGVGMLVGVTLPVTFGPHCFSVPQPSVEDRRLVQLDATMADSEVMYGLYPPESAMMIIASPASFWFGSPALSLMDSGPSNGRMFWSTSCQVLVVSAFGSAAAVVQVRHWERSRNVDLPLVM